MLCLKSHDPAQSHPNRLNVKQPLHALKSCPAKWHLNNFSRISKYRVQLFVCHCRISCCFLSTCLFKSSTSEPQIFSSLSQAGILAAPLFFQCMSPQNSLWLHCQRQEETQDESTHPMFALGKKYNDPNSTKPLIPHLRYPAQV